MAGVLSTHDAYRYARRTPPVLHAEPPAPTGNVGVFTDALRSRRAALLHSLDVVDALVDVCGDFLSSKVAEDLWPLLKVRVSCAALPIIRLRVDAVEALSSCRYVARKRLCLSQSSRTLPTRQHG